MSTTEGTSTSREYLVYEGVDGRAGDVVTVTGVGPGCHVFVVDVLHHVLHVELNQNKQTAAIQLS